MAPAIFFIFGFLVLAGLYVLACMHFGNDM